MSQQNPFAKELAGLIVASKSAMNGNYSSCVTLTILLYDTLSTFPKELDYIWRNKWSIPKVIYILLRYYGMIHIGILVSTLAKMMITICKFYNWLISLGPVIFQTAVFFVITIRLYALYNRKIKILVFLVILILSDFAIALQGSVITGIKTTQGLISVPFGLPITACITTGAPSKAILLRIWITSWSVSAIHFGMTMYKFLEGRRYRAVVKRETQVPPLLIAFLRDGVVFYFVITVMILASATIEQLVLPEFGTICVPWFIGIYSYAGSHLILSLRVTAARGMGDSRERSTWKDAMSTLYFTPEARSGHLG